VERMEKKYLLKINPKDNVAVALFPIKQDSVIYLNGQELTALEDIPRGHKIALLSRKGRMCGSLGTL
jgi:altronate hydrolase